jgi:ABC-type bacteriocin/lantibiotic exporter with double-glycine peptidase domain
LSLINPSVKLALRVISPFHKRVCKVMAVVVIDNFLASIGIGMIFPLFQAIIDPNFENEIFRKYFPYYAELSQQTRVFIIIAFAFVIFLMRFFTGLLNASMVRSMTEEFRKYWCDRIGANILYGSYQNFIQKKQGMWLNDWLTEPICASRFYSCMLQYISSLTMFIFLFIMGMLVEFKLMILLSVIMIFVTLISHRYMRDAAIDHSRNKSHVIQQLSSCINESLSHIKDIKALNGEQSRLNEMNNYLDRLRSLFVRAEVASVLPRLVGELLSITIFILIFVILVLIPSYKFDQIFPLLIVFFILFYRMLTSAASAMNARIRALHEYYSVKLVDDLMLSIPIEKYSGVHIGDIRTGIEFRNISFTYQNGKKVFKELNLILPLGALIIIAGKSGVGKTTLVDMLLRFITPQEGEIIANGNNINTFNLFDWRRNFGYVNQDASLFFGSIRSNLKISCPDADEFNLEEICRLAGCHDFISKLPDGYETVVGERGYSLSGGQRKRLAIARALINNPKYLILDEATTAFEIGIEKEIINQLRSIKPELSIILISHRLDESFSADMNIEIKNFSAYVSYK